ncbi:hypothetical protein WKI65_43150 [Streptomyces sp. MS1.AVA.3]|uniref:hypothetical protein n=1 Tax=Streptomyces decoyicus TaxID=249567 RepID=UPI0030C1FF1D
MTLAGLHTKVTPCAKRAQEMFLSLLFATAGLIVARTAAGIAADNGQGIGWQFGFGLAGYALAITLLANLSSTDPLASLAAATGTLAILVSALLRLAAAVIVLLGTALTALAGVVVTQPATT